MTKKKKNKKGSAEQPAATTTQDVNGSELEYHLDSDDEPTSSRAEQPARNNTGQHANSSAGQPAVLDSGAPPQVNIIVYICDCNDEGIFHAVHALIDGSTTLHDMLTGTFDEYFNTANSEEVVAVADRFDHGIFVTKKITPEVREDIKIETSLFYSDQYAQDTLLLPLVERYSKYLLIVI